MHTEDIARMLFVSVRENTSQTSLSNEEDTLKVQ